MLLNNKNTLFNSLCVFLYKTKHLTIICPYIKLNALTKLLGNTYICKQIIVRWEAKDIISGVSDLDIFGFCQENGITLYWNKRIHLKVYWNGNESAFITSANISKRALGYEFDAKSNHEIGTIIDNLSLDDKVYFQRIINESLLVTPQIYNSLKQQIEDYNADNEDFDFEEDWDDSVKSFLISSLPMSDSVSTLKDAYFKRKKLPDEDISYAVHDIALYQISQGLSESEFDITLQKNFLSHPFISTFLQVVDSEIGGMYFGQVKEWFKNNTTTVPIPRRYELTENTKILYNWIVELTQGKYQVDVPGRRSQRISRVK